MTNLSHRLALVTGSARGIGLACAKALAAAGATVIRQRVIHHVLAERGGLDVLVNNAGTTGSERDLGPQDPEHASLDAWQAVHAINLDGVFLGCKYGIIAMRSRGTGSIINMSSRSGLVGIPAAAAYASSKAAIRNHTKTVALYCAEQGLAIRCNSLHPAAVLEDDGGPALLTAVSAAEVYDRAILALVGSHLATAGATASSRLTSMIVAHAMAPTMAITTLRVMAPSATPSAPKSTLVSIAPRNIAPTPPCG